MIDFLTIYGGWLVAVVVFVAYRSAANERDKWYDRAMRAMTLAEKGVALTKEIVAGVETAVKQSERS